VSSNIKHVLLQIHADPYVPGSCKIIRYYMQQLMHRDKKDRKYYQPQASVEKDVSERKVTANIDPDEKSDSEKNYAGRPEKNHKTRFSPDIIKHKIYQLVVRYFKYLPVFRLILKIFNP
jgi:hypothetical protein